MTNSAFEEVSREAGIKDGVKQITYGQFIKIKNYGEDYVLVDARTPESYNTGHIPGAISFPLKTMDSSTAERLLSKDSKIVTYCSSFACPTSTKAARKFSELGYDALDYKGGAKEWQENGNKLIIGNGSNSD